MASLSMLAKAWTGMKRVKPVPRRTMLPPMLPSARPNIAAPELFFFCSVQPVDVVVSVAAFFLLPKESPPNWAYPACGTTKTHATSPVQKRRNTMTYPLIVEGSRR